MLVGPGQQGLKIVGDPQRGPGGKPLGGCAGVTIVLAGGRAPLRDIIVGQHIPGLPVVENMDADINLIDMVLHDQPMGRLRLPMIDAHRSLCPDDPLDGGYDARKLQHKEGPARHHYARGMVKPSSAVGEPPVKRLAHNILGHPTVLSMILDGQRH